MWKQVSTVRRKALYWRGAKECEAKRPPCEPLRLREPVVAGRDEAPEFKAPVLYPVVVAAVEAKACVLAEERACVLTEALPPRAPAPPTTPRPSASRCLAAKACGAG